MSSVIKRVGHGGASALARANTLESFDAALEVGVDMIEFDVRPCAGRLVLAHTLLHTRPPARRGPLLTLDRALAHLSAPRFAGIELDLDLKRRGSGPAALDALRRHGLLDRALLSSQVPEVLDEVRRADPRARTGISIGGRLARSSRRWRDWRTAVLVALRAGRFDALMAHHPLVDARLAAEVRERGGELYAWTIHRRADLERLLGLELTGIATSDPRLFAL